MGKYKDLTGQKFGRLTVIERAETKKGGYRWLCSCECGNTKIIYRTALTSGETKSCGCYRKEVGSQKNRKYSGTSTENKVYIDYKRRANKKGLKFELSKEEFLEISQQNCFYCGIIPSTIRKSRYNNGNFIYNGIDRIDNTKGYIKENVVPCCQQCNMAKNQLTTIEFYKWNEKVYKHRNSTLTK